MRKPNTDKEFWSRVDKTGDCWLWMTRKHPAGYGQFDYAGKTVMAHRLAYVFSNNVSLDSISGLDVLHSCDNPPCVNPAHLRTGTHKDNMEDKAARGRAPRGSRSPLAKLTEAHVVIIRTVGRSLPRKVLADAFGVNRQLISNILCGRIWKHVEVKNHLPV